MPKLKVTSEFDTKGFKKGKEESESIFSTMGKSAKSLLANPIVAASAVAVGAIAGITAGVAAAISSMIEMSRELAEISSKTGGTASQTRALIRGVKGDAGAIEGSMASLVVKIQEAKEGNEDAIKSFRAFGLTIQDFDGKSRVDQFTVMVQAMKDMGTSTESMTKANRILGEDGVKQYDNLTSSLANWANSSDLAFDESVAKAEALGFQLDMLKEDTIEALFQGLEPLVELLVENADVLEDVAKSTKYVVSNFISLSEIAIDVSKSLNLTIQASKALAVIFKQSLGDLQGEYNKTNKEIKKLVAQIGKWDEAEGKITSKLKAKKLILDAVLNQAEVIKQKAKENRTATEGEIQATKEQIIETRKFIASQEKSVQLIIDSTKKSKEKETQAAYIIGSITRQTEALDLLIKKQIKQEDSVQKAEDKKRAEYEKTAAARLKFEEAIAKKLQDAAIKEVEKIKELVKTIDTLLKPEAVNATKDKFKIDDIKEGKANSAIRNATSQAANKGATLDELKVIAGVIKERQDAGEEISKTTLRNFQTQVDLAEAAALESKKINEDTLKIIKAKDKLEADNRAIANGQKPLAAGVNIPDKVNDPLKHLEEANSLQVNILDELKLHTASLSTISENTRIGTITLT